MKKNLKCFITIIVILVLTFTLTGCGKEEIPNNIIESNEENNSQNDNSKESINLYSDDNKIVFNYMDVYYITYYHEGERITGLDYIYKFDDEETAKITKTMFDSTYEEEEDVKEIVINGKYIIISFTEEAYKNETLESVKTTYSYLEQIYKNN